MDLEKNKKLAILEYGKQYADFQWLRIHTDPSNQPETSVADFRAS